MNRILDILTAWLPRKVRVWHFLVIPAVAMAAIIVPAEGVDRLLEPRLGGAAFSAYQVFRNAVISLFMAAILAMLVVRYRSAYEEELQARNEALETTRDFLAAIIDSSGEAIVTLDPEGRVSSWNPAAERIYGWNAAEMLRRNARAMFSDTQLRELRDFETTHHRKDGVAIQIQVTQAPLHDPTGRYIGSTAIVRDVTALKDMEAKLVESERMAAIGELAATMAHEIKNPLAGMRGAMDILVDSFDTGDRRGALSEEVVRQIDRLNRTVQDVLLFSRPRAMELEPTHAHQLIDRVVRLLEKDREHAGTKLIRDYAADVDYVRADPRHLEHVLLNVLLNACQATDDRGRVTVSTSRNGSTVEIAVEDDGPGIPPEDAERIFQPFYTTKSKGSGLGLALVRRIVEAHGGVVDVSSRPGEGARFVLTLPAESGTA